MPIRIILFSILFSFAIFTEANCETYYIRNNGLATKELSSQTAGGNCFSDNNSMNLKTHNSSTFSPGDTIYICNKIIDNTRLTPPSNGLPSNFITYRGDFSNSKGSMEQNLIGTTLYYMMHIRNKQYIKIINLDFKSNQGMTDTNNRAAIWIEEYFEPTGNIEINNCSFTETVQGILIRGDTRHVNIFKSTFKNMVTNGIGTFTYYGRTDKLRPSFLTIGGSRENGNTFINIGREDNPTSGSVPGQVIGTQVDDLVFSYNHIYADEPGWGTGIYLNGVHRVLVEYNYIHDLDSTHRRAAITFKTDYDWINTDIVIRFNKIGPTHGGRTYTTPTSAITVGHCLKNAIIYGNLITDVVGFGIHSSWGWGSEGANDGCINEDVFIFSNIIDRTRTASGIYLAGTSGTDCFKNTYITNNLFYRPVSEDTTTHWYNYGIHTEVGGDHNYQGLFIFNNIIDTPRFPATDRIGIRALTQNDMLIDYNHHYFPGATPQVYFKNSSCTPCEWNSSKKPSGYGTNDTAGEPMFKDPLNGNFTLKENSPLINSGKTLDAKIPSFKIQNIVYNFSLSTALDPIKTDWSKTIPIVYTLDQNSYGKWEKGAYVHRNQGPAILASPERLIIRD